MNSNTPNISIVICDDHPIFRQGLNRIIEREESFEIAGECGDGDSAIELIQTKIPNIAILDITMPGRSGLSVAKYIKNTKIPTKIIMLTMHKDEEYLNEAIEIGVDGYLLKENATSDLAICINKIINGEHYVSPLLESTIRKYSRNAVAENSYLSNFETLSHIEKSILKLIAFNKTSQDISEELNLNFKDLLKHRNKIIDKLQLHGPYKLYEFALRYKDSL